MPDSSLTPPRDARPPEPQLRPSEYTGALIQALRLRADRVRGATVLEIGSGSGVVLAALGRMGARALAGVDIEADAVALSRALLGGLGLDDGADIHCGDMWTPVQGRRFDLIVANLPHYPMERGDLPGRRPTWSAGGPDGRRLIDPFIQGLAHHLAPGGRAVMTHNAFVDLERTRALAAAAGLIVREVLTTMVFVTQEKLDCMTDAIRRGETGRSIQAYGPYAFAEVHVVEVGAPAVFA